MGRLRNPLDDSFMANKEPIQDGADETDALEIPEIVSRPRRNRKSEAVRSLVRETHLRRDNLIWPLFVVDGSSQKIPIDSMPDCYNPSLPFQGISQCAWPIMKRGDVKGS